MAPKNGKQQLSEKPRQKEAINMRKNEKKSDNAPSNKNKEKKLLVLDLDDTLTYSRHATFDDDTYDLSFTFTGYESAYYVKKRPGVDKFLERVAEMFDVYVFTASDKDYADRILDFLDPEGKHITKRVYIDSGVYLSDGYAKDLTVFGVDLAKVAIIDNCPHNFRLQKNNGIPITSWSFDPQDEELLSLIPFLKVLDEADDVRPIIAQRYGKNEKKVGNASFSKKMESKNKEKSTKASALSTRMNNMTVT